MANRIDDIAFQQGVAYAVAFLIRQDEMSLAQEIWEATSQSLDCVADYDANPIRFAVSTDWCETWQEARDA